MDRSSVDASIVGRAPSPAFSAIGVWFRLVFVGVSLLVGGIAMLFQPDRDLTITSALALGGAVLTLVAWQKLRGLLRAEDEPTPDRYVTERPARERALAARS